MSIPRTEEAEVSQEFWIESSNDSKMSQRTRLRWRTKMATEQKTLSHCGVCFLGRFKYEYSRLGNVIQERKKLGTEENWMYWCWLHYRSLYAIKKGLSSSIMLLHVHIASWDAYTVWGNCILLTEYRGLHRRSYTRIKPHETVHTSFRNSNHTRIGRMYETSRVE
jgi:hypothetical protein